MLIIKLNVIKLLFIINIFLPIIKQKQSVFISQIILENFYFCKIFTLIFEFLKQTIYIYFLQKLIIYHNFL